MRDPGLAIIFDVGLNRRDYDRDRYVSMVAVPIKVGRETKPWGVVTVTTDRPNHFNLDVGNRVTTSEPARAVAAMAGLAIKALGERSNGGNSAGNAAPGRAASETRSDGPVENNDINQGTNENNGH